MRKVLFLMFLLLLTGLGAAGVKAQVRIGGNTPPNPAAALDLNAAEGTTTGTKGLALPRVTLSSNTATLDGTTVNITGMLVYNIGGSLSTGVYFWNGSNWVNDRYFIGTDSIAGLNSVRIGDHLVYDGSTWRVTAGDTLITYSATMYGPWTAGSMKTMNITPPAGCTAKNTWTGRINFNIPGGCDVNSCSFNYLAITPISYTGTQYQSDVDWWCLKPTH